MKAECLIRKGAAPQLEVLLNFLKSTAAMIKYGKTVVYEGETYYIPYYRQNYHVQETGETYVFLNSQLSDDIAVYKENGSVMTELIEEQVQDCYVLKGKKIEKDAKLEIQKKIKLNRKMRKTSVKYHLEEQPVSTVYLPEQTFYVKGKSNYLFLVDGFLGKVDYRHLEEVKRQFAQNYLNERA